MALAHSKVTARGQISVPAGVQRSTGFTSLDIHRELFPQQAPKSRTVDDMKEGIRRRAWERHARH
jgi:hypothetical protein